MSPVILALNRYRFRHPDFSVRPGRRDALWRTLTNFRIVAIILGELEPLPCLAVAKGLDNHCIQAILNLDIDGMKTQEACGKLPMLTLMHLAWQKGWKAQLPDYHDGGEVTGKKEHVAGGSASAFYEPVPEAYVDSERKFLLHLARTALAHVATNPDWSGPELSAKEVPPKLAETKACFVTLMKHGELRGCVGHIFPLEPLYRAIEDNARNAATRDPRFQRVLPEEVDKIRIEISVLTAPQPLRFNSPEDLLGKLQPYNDGVLLEIGFRRATFLPHVWEQLPDKIEFLNQLSEKAGCEPSAWRSKKISVSIYHVEAFKDSE